MNIQIFGKNKCFDTKKAVRQLSATSPMFGLSGNNFSKAVLCLRTAFSVSVVRLSALYKIFFRKMLSFHKIYPLSVSAV